MTKVELYQGEVRSENIGPARGEHLLGKIDGPGLYLFVGPNATGKSQHLSLLGRLQDERLDRATAPITDGELTASLSVGEAKVVFRSAGGKPARPRREGTEKLPEIKSMPAPIGDLISGGHLKGDEPRARRRLESLLAYAPIDATEETAAALCRFSGLAFDVDGFTTSQRLAWRELLRDLERQKPRAQRSALMTGAEVVAWLRSQPREGVLEDHDLIRKSLNELAATAEHLLGIQGEHIAAAEGGLQSVLDPLTERLGAGADITSRIESAPPESEARAAAQAARDRAAELRIAARGKLQEEERREQLRASHGDRPSEEVEEEAVEVAKEALRRAEAAELEAAKELEEFKRSAAVLKERLQLCEKAVHDTWDGLAAKLMEGMPYLDGNVTSRIDDIVRLAAQLRALWEEAVSQRSKTLEAQNEAEDARGLLLKCAADRKQAAEALEAAESRLARVSGLIGEWERVEQLLAEPVPGPEEKEVAAAAQAAEEAEIETEIAAVASRYKTAAAQLEDLRQIGDWLGTLAEEYRSAAAESWGALGDLMTEHLDLPWLSVSGQRIILHYDTETGRLRQDKSRKAEERDLDDQDRVSTAELHEAMLRLMLSKREGLGGILTLPWSVIAALDGARLSRLAQDCEGAGLIVVSERPRRDGDAEELHLEKVG